MRGFVMHRRTKATNIPQDVKRAVYKRDRERCVLCGGWVTPECANAHVINRSQGGLGVEQNIITACWRCHNEMDNGKSGTELRKKAVEYLKSKYDGWTRESVTYRKGEA